MLIAHLSIVFGKREGGEYRSGNTKKFPLTECGNFHTRHGMVPVAGILRGTKLEAPHEGRKGRMWQRFVFMIRDRKVFGPLEYALIIAFVATALLSVVSAFGNG